MIGSPKHKYATIGFVYLFGLICASFLESAACFVIFEMFAVVFVFSIRKNDKFFMVNLTFLAAAFLFFGLYRAVYIDSCAALDGQSGIVKGAVSEIRSPDNDTVLLTLSGTADGKPVRLTLFTNDTGIAVGDRVEFEAVFSEFTNSAEFSESGYYFSKGIFLKAYAVSEITCADGNGGIGEWLSEISGYFKNIIEINFSEGEGGIIKAMFFGDKSGLSDRTKADIRRSGIAHLTAVSGMHLSLMVHFFAGFLSLVFRRGGRGYFAVIAGYIVLLMLFFGMTASVMRSGFMMIVFYGSELVRRKSDTLASVGAALLIILLFNPCACRDMGLIMSALGTIGVGIVAPKAAEALKIRRKGFIKSTLFTSLCAFICTMPVGAFCFGGVSFAAPLTGILVQPFFTVILMLVPIALLLPFFAVPLLYVAGIAAWIMENIASFISSFEFAYAEIDGDTMALFLVLMVSGAALTSFLSRRLKATVLFAGVCVFAFAGSFALSGIIGYDDIKIKVYSDNGNAVLRVTDKTGESFYALEGGGDFSDRVYGLSSGAEINFICLSQEGADRTNILSLCKTAHFPENGAVCYDISGEYTVTVSENGMILDIRGITIGVIPAGSDVVCDIAVYSGYKENYGNGGSSATILCNKKYYNCEDAVNAFLHETEIIINSEGKYALEIR